MPQRLPRIFRSVLCVVIHLGDVIRTACSCTRLPGVEIDALDQCGHLIIHQRGHFLIRAFGIYHASELLRFTLCTCHMWFRLPASVTSDMASITAVHGFLTHATRALLVSVER